MVDRSDFGAMTIKDYLETERGSVRVPSLVIPDLTTVLESFGMSNGEEVESMGLTAILQAVKQTGVFDEDEGLPIVNLTVTQWYENEPGPKVKATTPSLKKGVPLGGSAKGSGPATMADPTLEADMKAMGMTEGEITSLALSGETGVLHSEYEVIDTPYQSDPCLHEITKARRKSGLESISKVP